MVITPWSARVCACALLWQSGGAIALTDNSVLQKTYYWDKQWGNQYFGAHMEISSAFHGNENQVENINTLNAVSFIFGRRDAVLQGKMVVTNTTDNTGELQSSLFVFGNKVAGQQTQDNDDTLSQIYNLVFDHTQDFGVVIGPVNLNVTVGVAGKADSSLTSQLTPYGLNNRLRPNLVTETYIQGQTKAFLVNGGLEGRITLFSEVLDMKTQMGKEASTNHLCHAINAQREHTSLNGKVTSFLRVPLQKLSLDLFNHEGVKNKSTLLDEKECQPPFEASRI